MKRRLLNAFLVLILFAVPDLCASEDGGLSDAEIEGKIKGAQEFFQSKYRTLEKEVNELFQIDFAALSKEFESKLKEFRLKTAMVNGIGDPKEREKKTKALKEEYQDGRFDRYLEAYDYLEKAAEKDRVFVGTLLAKLREILDQVIAKDPLFNYIFVSKGFRSEYGLVLKRVVWRTTELKNVSAETKPLEVHSAFGDKSRVPILMKLTPIAFTSLAFLRSILVHELNHVCFYKDPKFSDAKQFGGWGREPAKGEFSHYFKQLNPYQPSYQYQLLNEYYSFRAQLLFDDRFQGDPYYRLTREQRRNVEKTLEWLSSQLNEGNKAFVRENPDPAISELIEKFY